MLTRTTANCPASNCSYDRTTQIARKTYSYHFKHPTHRFKPRESQFHKNSHNLLTRYAGNKAINVTFVFPTNNINPFLVEIFNNLQEIDCS